MPLRRIQRDATYEPVIQQLCGCNTPCFDEIWKLILFCALLGKAKGRRRSLRDRKQSNSIRHEVFANSPLRPGIMHLFAILETRDSVQLRSEHWEESLGLFEEYANGGFELLQQESAGGALGLIEVLNMLGIPANEKSGRDNVSDIRI